MASKAKQTIPQDAPSVMGAVPILDQLNAAVDDLRQQLRRGGAVELPALVAQLLPPLPIMGDKVLVLDWRSFAVWATWSGTAWQVDIYDGAQLRVIQE